MRGTAMKGIAAWWALFLLALLLIVIGLQGSGGRVLAVLLTPGRLTVNT